MVTFGDEDNMVERFVEIDARVFLDGTLTSRRVFQLTGPGTRIFTGISLRRKVLTLGLRGHSSFFFRLVAYFETHSSIHKRPWGLAEGLGWPTKN